MDQRTPGPREPLTTTAGLPSPLMLAWMRQIAAKLTELEARIAALEP